MSLKPNICTYVCYVQSCEDFNAWAGVYRKCYRRIYCTDTVHMYCVVRNYQLLIQWRWIMDGLSNFYFIKVCSKVSHNLCKSSKFITPKWNCMYVFCKICFPKLMNEKGINEVSIFLLNKLWFLNYHNTTKDCNLHKNRIWNFMTLLALFKKNLFFLTLLRNLQKHCIKKDCPVKTIYQLIAIFKGFYHTFKNLNFCNGPLYNE